MHSHTPFKRSTIALLAAALLTAGQASAVVTDEDILNDAKTNGDVVSFGLGTQGQRHSPMTQINTKSVKNLVPAWSMSFGGEKQRGQESQPVIHNGKMFVTASYSRLFAMDAKTGKKLWKYEHRLPDGIMPCCDVINRGAALYGDLVIFGTLDAQLVALNQNTGKVVWKEKVGDYAAGYSLTAAPIIAKGKLITGVSGGEFGIVGRVDARDPLTGKLLWTRPTVEGHMGYKFDAAGNKMDNGISGTTNATWQGDLWKTGGAATWNGATYAPEPNLIFAGTGNPAPWNSHNRPGDNLFSCSTVAIDADTGKIVWHCQGTPHDGWDFDGVNEFVSFDFKDPKTGKIIKAGGKADRNGFFFVNDRTNGKPLNIFPFVKDITWAKGFDLNTGRPIYNMENYPGDPAASADGKKGAAVFAAPSFLGGKNQMQMAYSPQTNLFYVPSNEWGLDIKALHDDYIGAMRAVDPATGKIVWENKNYAPLWGGVMTTAGGLVFYGTPEGFLKGVDAKTGKELWSFNVGTGIVAPPVTWEQDGEQMIAVTAGWGGAVPLWGGDVAKRVNYLEQGGSVWVFKLHKAK